jgi:Ca2+-binding RTX toxin-like protein
MRRPRWMAKNPKMKVAAMATYWSPRRSGARVPPTMLTKPASRGDDGNDFLYTRSTGTDSLSGGIGNDTLTGAGGGTYTLDGGAGSDTIRGNVGNDYITTGRGTESIDGGNDNDTILYSSNSGQNDTLDGGSGNDLVIFQGKTQANIQSEQTAGGITTIVFSPASGGQTVFVQNVETLQFQDGTKQTIPPGFPTIPERALFSRWRASAPRTDGSLRPTAVLRAT